MALSDVTQLSMLPGYPAALPIVNVASVPQRSPFRYPGGKTWLIPVVRRWLAGLPRRPSELIEPFAGGASIGLTAAFEGLVDHVTLVELDPQVAAVWQTILSGDYEWLADQILHFTLTPQTASETLATPPTSTRERAFQTILKNRVQRGGILAPGAGLIKNGEAGKGILSRWYPETLSRRILAIGKIRDRLSFQAGDGLQVIAENSGNLQAAFFIDPPYTADGKRAGARLYTCFELDHSALFALAGQIVGDFLMTYDNAPGVLELARKQGFQTEPVAMKSTHHAAMTELLITPPTVRKGSREISF